MLLHVHSKEQISFNVGLLPSRFFLKYHVNKGLIKIKNTFLTSALQSVIAINGIEKNI